MVGDTLGALLKYQDDIARIEGTKAKELLDQVHAELAQVVAGQKPGRRTADEITIFDSSGVAVEDVAAAVAVYEKALAAGRGLSVDLAS